MTITGFKFHVRSKYVWMGWHNYLGPRFYTMHKGKEIPYKPSIKDPVWICFDNWFQKKKQNRGFFKA